MNKKEEIKNLKERVVQLEQENENLSKHNKQNDEAIKKLTNERIRFLSDKEKEIEEVRKGDKVSLKKKDELIEKQNEYIDEIKNVLYLTVVELIGNFQNMVKNSNKYTNRKLEYICIRSNLPKQYVKNLIEELSTRGIKTFNDFDDDSGTLEIGFEEESYIRKLTSGESINVLQGENEEDENDEEDEL